MSVKKAAIEVLRSAAGPLTAPEITKRILSEGLWKSGGVTPEATVSAQLYMDIKRGGGNSSFIQVGPNTFALRNGTEQQTKATKAAAKTSKQLSFTEAAEKILEQFGNRRPMHYRAITDKALELDWVATEGETPEATMYAQILTEIRRRQTRGEQPRFIQHGRGFVGLTRWAGRGLAFEIEQHNQKVRQALHKRVLAMEAYEFEELIAQLLAAIGFEDIEVTRRGGDGGIDVRGTLVVGEVIRTRMAVQAKRWKLNNRVQSPIVQQVRGSLGTHEQGLIITTSDFSAGAKAEAIRGNAVPVALMNGEQLMALLAQFEIGVSRRAHDLLEIHETDPQDNSDST